MGKLNLRIITPERLVYENKVDKFSAMTEAGSVGILPLHIPLVSVLKPGEIIVQKDGIAMPMALSGGILEVKPSKNIDGEVVTDVVVLADHIELAFEINLEKSKEAYERAKEAMQKKENMLDVDFARLQAKIEKELNRVKVGNKYRK